jgi:hypothetical protein
MKKSYLGEIDIVRIARWENKLNSWQWPDDFPIKKPRGFDKLPNYSSNKNIKTKFNIINPLIYDIINAIGEKETFRWHHIDNLNKNNFQFEMWWFFNKVNSLFQSLRFKNFYIDIYRFFGWEDY